MIKMITTLKKKSGMSTERFRAYYENHHRLIGEKYLKGYASRYVRRYLNPVPDEFGELLAPEFDVLLEIWFADEVALQACMVKLNEPTVAEEIAVDEEKLFDRSLKRSYTVDENESMIGELL
ncbi:MAG: EthD domain-containing protein [Pseudomonadales bacterium]